ncbi:LAME_0D01134g1_1 [Lachancea meyersii CBS 8951]|uniref:LAME_0D01134g1_1 n=1 Tax=Lachancea meyersii CBS 8951 TaxID=1266667 RepID=A0A1G4J6I6_9SACH|nr:LAME_0D01134g1_1 [Lachancea meyersii CBS 8951]
MSQGLVVRSNQAFNTSELYNVLPRGYSNGWEPQVRLFEGCMRVCELMSKTDDLPWYRIVFAWGDGKETDTNDDKRFFTQTVIMRGTRDLNKTIQSTGEFFEILVKCTDDTLVALELRIRDPQEEQNFRDLLFRIREEYEMIDEMLGGSDSSEYGEFVGS